MYHAIQKLEIILTVPNIMKKVNVANVLTELISMIMVFVFQYPITVKIGVKKKDVALVVIKDIN